MMYLELIVVDGEVVWFFILEVVVVEVIGDVIGIEIEVELFGDVLIVNKLMFGVFLWWLSKE